MIRLLPAGVRRHVRLAADLAVRDLRDRFAGSLLGLGWLLLTPAAYLGIYWFVFGQVLRLGWPGAGEGGGEGFLLPFFTGLVVYLFLVDLTLSSVTLFASRRDYVRRAPFPIWVLWLANLLRSGAAAAVSLALLLVLALAQRRLGFEGLAWALPALGLIVLFLGATSLALALLGAFIADLVEVLRVATRVLFYAAPIGYPLSLVPEDWRALLWLNPLTLMVEPLRAAVVFDAAPAGLPMLALGLATLGMGLLARWLYLRLAGIVADVV